MAQACHSGSQKNPRDLSSEMIRLALSSAMVSRKSENANLVYR